MAMRRPRLLLGLLWIALCGTLASLELVRQPEMSIRWATETEVDTLGFNVRRATVPEGPFQQINPFLIPSSTDPLVGAEYEYLDSALEAGRRYYYQLEEVETDGTSNYIELAAGTAQGVRPWMLLLSASGVVVGALLFASALRQPGTQAAAMLSVGCRPAEEKSEALD
jgi:hypothetical protein